VLKVTRARSKSHGSRTNPSTKGTGSDVLMHFLPLPEYGLYTIVSGDTAKHFRSTTCVYRRLSMHMGGWVSRLLTYLVSV
jgi:hypothetical protein